MSFSSNSFIRWITEYAWRNFHKQQNLSWFLRTVITSHTLFIMFHCPTLGKTSFSLPLSWYFSYYTKSRIPGQRMSKDANQLLNHRWKLTNPWGRQNTSFDGCKTLINPYAKFLCIWIFKVCIVMHSLIKIRQPSVQIDWHSWIMKAQAN